MDQNDLNPEVFLKKGHGCDDGLQIPENSWGGGATARILRGGTPLQQHVCVSFSWKMEQKKRHREKFQAHLSSFAWKDIQQNFGSACQNNGVYGRLAQKPAQLKIHKESQTSLREAERPQHLPWVWPPHHPATCHRFPRIILLRQLNSWWSWRRGRALSLKRTLQAQFHMSSSCNTHQLTSIWMCFNTFY